MSRCNDTSAAAAAYLLATHLRLARGTLVRSSTASRGPRREECVYVAAVYAAVLINIAITPAALPDGEKVAHIGAINPAILIEVGRAQIARTVHCKRGPIAGHAAASVGDDAAEVAAKSRDGTYVHSGRGSAWVSTRTFTPGSPGSHPAARQSRERYK